MSHSKRTLKIKRTPKIIRPLRRSAALLCAALTGLGLASLGRDAHAAPSGPLATSPPTPTPFQSPVYHSGGGPTPYPVSPLNPAPPPAGPTAAPYLTPLIDPLQGQLQGTPTELYNGNITQIPSYSLGNYDPTRPPAGFQVGGLNPGVNVYYPNHFADGGIFSWAAPFSYFAQNANPPTADDSLTTKPGPGVSSFTATSGWVPIIDPIAFPAAGTATNGEYLRIAPLAAGDNATYQAVWTLYQPTAGNYSLYFHIPNDLPSGATPPVPEVRDTQVVYAVAVRDAAGNVTVTSTATASQTEANDSQFLAGPFQVAAGGSVVVTLTRRGYAATNNTPPYNNAPPAVNNNNDYLVADSMTLQPTVGDVQSAPTAITYDLYPTDFSSTAHPLQYWGIFVPPTSTLVNGQQTGGTSAAANALPDTTATPTPTVYNTGNILLKSGNAAAALGQDAATPDPFRRIRQLVYFGRSDPSASVSRSVDDSAGAPAFVSSAAAAIITNTTASNGKYSEYSATNGLIGVTNLVATWTVPVPTAGVGSSFFVYAHIPANPATAPEIRLSQVYYTVTTSAGTTPPVAISQITQGTDALVVLPTGPLTAAGTSIVVRLYSANNSTTATSPNGAVVVADSVTVSTGTGQGAIYCVDGFTGGVVWRFQTPGSANGASAPVFASPVITKINVLVTPATATTAAVYANRLVAIVGDNNGQVYCLDAIGNGDGTSNYNVINPATGAPITIPQPAYGGLYGAIGTTPLKPTDSAAADALIAHVGTTGVYWIYRPDAGRPKNAIGAVKTPDPTTDVPVPAAFATASPNVFVDPTVPTTPDTATGVLKSNAIVYIGNSNGVLYALNALGAGIDGTSATAYTASGDRFNVSQMGATFDIPTTGNPTGSPFPLTAVVPTPQPLWWFSLRGVDPNGGNNASSADIESAPAIYVKATASTTVGAAATFTPTVYIGSAHELETTSNVGRLYALNGLYGPSGNNGRSSPLTQPNPAAAGYTGPGSFNYNVGQRPQVSPTDTDDWSFPDAVGQDTYTTKSKSSSGKPRPALGNITGSPVVFTNTDENIANVNNDGTPTHPATSKQTRIYFAADSGYESTTLTPTPTARPDSNLTGRLWAVNLDGSVGTTVSPTTTQSVRVWAFPLANDPNDATLDNKPEPDAPMGAFLRATPAIGFVQFPLVITNGDGNAYDPADAVNSGIVGKSVPMLYVGTAGVNDTALWAIDIDGDMTPDSTTAAGLDTRTIYRVVSPDGSIFQSSPALVANASSTGGNGGGVYAVAGNTLYDYSATPISNPFTGQAYPLIRENAAFAGFGPISSPALAGANTTDLSGTFLATVPGAAGLTNTSVFTTNTTDWIYVGDSSSGLCRGITPNDASYGGIAVGLGSIVPFDATKPVTYVLDAIEQAFLVDPAKAPTPTQSSKSSTDAALIGVNAPLQVFEWGESAYVRFTNVAPPNPKNDSALYVYDHRKYPDLGVAASSPIPFYTSDGSQAQSVQFNVSDASAGAGLGDLKYVNPQIVLTPPDGYVIDAAATPPSFFPDVTTNLATTGGKRYLGTYTYSIGDGSVLANTPGARRRFQNVKQLVEVYNYDGASYQPAGTTIIGGDATAENLVSQYNPATKQYGFTATSKIAAVDQPTFGILNPLGVRGGGVNLLAPGPAVPIGDPVTGELGPFRSVQSPPTLGVTPTAGQVTDNYALQALTNGNDVPTVAPPSSSGVGGSPILRPEGVNDPTGISTPTMTNVIVTTTGEIAHNTTGDNGEPSAGPITGQYSNTTTDGLLAANFGGYGLDIFDRSALFNLGQNLRLKMTVPTNVAYSPSSGKDGLYWNSNAVNDAGHGSVVNFLPWETPPVPYSVGIGSMTNGSQDYPDITPGNITQTALSITNKNGIINSGGDLTSNSVTLTPGYTTTTATARTVTADPIRIQVAVPHYQPANQQLYQQTAGQPYSSASTNQIAPVDDTGASQINTRDQVFPMGYITTKRLYVPDARGFYNSLRAYRDVRIYTGVPVDMRTSVYADTSATRDIGKVPAAFGVQTESDPNLSFFTPYNTLFQTYFKPLEIHNDGNVNLLNVHLDQKYINTTTGNRNTLFLSSDTVDPLSFLDGYDVNDITGPQDPTTGNRLAGGAPITLPNSTADEKPFLIRSSVDTDLVQAYGRNPYIAANYGAYYPSATFHKPIPGGSQPSTLTVPDAPERYVARASLDSALVPTLPSVTDPNNYNLPYKAQPFISLAMPFGTPVGTYSTPGASDPLSVRLFEGLDPTTKTNKGYVYSVNSASPLSTLYPPQYGGAIGGIGKPSSQPIDVYVPNFEPLSTSGTQLIGHVVEQRLTDGATFGAVPMIDSQSAGLATPPGGTAPVAVSTPDFAPAAFRDPITGDLSVYWTSGRSGGFGIFGANLPFVKSTTSSTPGAGYFLPTNPAEHWWNSIGGYNSATPPALLPVSGLATGTNSGLSVASGPRGGTNYAFDVAVGSTTPYSNTLYSYSAAPDTGVLSGMQAITPASSASQVKYSVKGLYTGFTNPLWAFWTASARGRTALYYNSQASSAAWGTTTNLLPVPAGLTAVADASPMLMMAPVNGAAAATIEVTYSGTAPDGNIDLYDSRYVPDTKTPSQLDLAAFPPVTENLRSVGGWYQARDVAWSRTGALNVSVPVGGVYQPILYNGNVPQFTKAIYDKASGLLVLTYVKVPIIPTTAGGTQQYTTNTVYVDAATGRIRFSPALLSTQNFAQIRATFSPEARRLTTDSRADTAPVTFLDDKLKPNDTPSYFTNTNLGSPVEADRRWTIWRKSGVSGTSGSASLYFKTQRLTFFLPSPVGVTTTAPVPPLTAPTYAANISSVTVNGTDVTKLVDVDYSRGRIYFPISTGAEGQTVAVTYTPLGANTPVTTPIDATNTVQWQDETVANDPNAVPFTNSIDALDAVNPGYGVPIDNAANENNVAAFLDPYAGTTVSGATAGTSVVTGSHKVWLFWNSTRNGTADIYSETIDPRFAPTTP